MNTERFWTRTSVLIVIVMATTAATWRHASANNVKCAIIEQEVSDIRLQSDRDEKNALALDLATFIKLHPECGRLRSAVDDIASLLNDDSDGVRYAAAMALGDIGPRAGRSVPALVRAMNRSDAILDAQHSTVLPTTYIGAVIRSAIRKITGKKIPEYNDVRRPAPPVKWPVRE